jgi:hypothetical protein
MNMRNWRFWVRLALLTLAALAATSPLRASAAVTPTSTSIFVYDSNLSSRLRGQHLAVGDVIRAYDPQGILCGEYSVSVTDEYSMSVYGNDIDTPVDEGATAGDVIRFTINDAAAVVYGGPVVFSDQAQFDIRLDVPETVLTFRTVPSLAVSGTAMVLAVEGQVGGVVDTTFTGSVTLGKVSGVGTLSGTLTVAAVKGVAVFTNAVYRAAADQETLALQATSAGATADTSTDVTADVVATRLRFAVEPAGATSGSLLATQPVVEAVDSLGVLDAGYAGPVALSSTAGPGGGSLSGTLTTAAVGGRATYANLRYTADYSGDAFRLTASSAALMPALSQVVTVTVTNRAPVADAGQDQALLAGVPVVLDGRGSTDADGDSLRYQWIAPPGVVLSDSSAPNPTLSGDVPPGIYAFVLVVSDGMSASAPDTVGVSIAEVPALGWSVLLTVACPESAEITLRFGLATGATDGLDLELGESELPPPPPQPRFDARWALAFSYGTWNDLRSPEVATPGATWTLVIQGGSEQAPAVVTWNPASLPDEGYFRIKGMVDGSPVDVDLRSQTSLMVASSETVELQLQYTTTITIDHRTTLRRGWSMVALPCRVADATRAAVYPGALSLFGFSAGYEERVSLEAGTGYWVNLPAVTTVHLIAPTWPDSALVRRWPARWSMVGAGSARLNVAALKAAYPTILSVFGDSMGYRLAHTLEPGQGYWLNLSAPTELDLSGRVGLLLTAKPGAATPVWTGPSLWVEGSGGSQELALGVSSDQVIELPPVPPAGLFDARVELPGGMQALQVPSGDGVWPLRLQGGVEQLRWQVPANSGWSLQIGDTVTPLSGAGQLVVGEGAQVLLRHGTFQPLATALKGAYPNPFNPSTTIHYDLSEPAPVRLQVYAVSGQLVRELVAAHQEAGAYRVEWDGRDAAGSAVGNGVYLGVLQAGDFRAVTRMVLMK